MISLKDKIVLITGASSGIGAACARKFAAKGAKVCLAARREEKLRDLCGELTESGSECHYLPADITDETQVRALFDSVTERFGVPQILVNNAGRGLHSELCSISLKEWESVMKTNVNGVFLCTREAVRRMIEKTVRGHIITVSSIAGLFGAPGFSAYCASKHAVNGFYKSIKWELKKQKIKLSAIYPARVNTEFFDIYKKRPGRNQMLSPDDIADFIIAISSRSFFMKLYVIILNVLKRMFYFLKFSFRRSK